MLNKDTFEPDPAVHAFQDASTSKNAWTMVLLIVRVLLRRSLSGTPTVTFCSVHISDVVAKNVTLPLTTHGDYMGTCSSTTWTSLGPTSTRVPSPQLAMCFRTQNFQHPAIRFCGGALEEPNRDCTGFLIMPKRPYDWRVDTHGCYKYDNTALGFGPRHQTAHLPVFLHLRTTNLPGPNSIMRSEQAQQRRFERST